LVEDLWDSIAADPEALSLTDAQREELDRRLADHDADPSSAVSWEEVRRRLYQKYG
jgi:putative addiction module component (TIGR02574 family)